MKYFFYLLFFFAMAAHAAELKPFNSDGCSAFPDGTLQQNQLWLQCCTAHDLTYWMGGTYKQRLEADRELERCVTAVGEPAIATLMLAGVRIGGTPFLPTRFRWGYGWPYPRFYGELNGKEREQIRRETLTERFQRALGRRLLAVP